MFFKTMPQISHLCFLKIHKFFINSSWKLKIIFKTFATNFTFIIFKSQTLSWDRKNWFLIFIHQFSTPRLGKQPVFQLRARKQIFRPPSYEILLFCMEWKLNNYKGNVFPLTCVQLVGCMACIFVFLILKNNKF